MHKHRRLLQCAQELYRASSAGENALGNSANLIFALHTPRRPLILRVSPYSPEKARHIDFELGWLVYLAQTLSGVAAPVPSRHGQCSEIVETERGSHILCAFEMAPGRHVDPGDPGEWNPSLFTRLGRLMGDIHRLTKCYPLRLEHARRFTWNRDIFFGLGCETPEDDIISRRWEQLVSQMRQLPTDPNSYGVVHNDCHHQNFFVDGERITLFDFDDCIYSWYYYDIALTLYHAVDTIPLEKTDDRSDFAHLFLESFLQGYAQAVPVDRMWLSQLDMMLRFRRICAYRFIRQLLACQEDHPHREYLHRLRQDIARDTPVATLKPGNLAAI